MGAACSSAQNDVVKIGESAGPTKALSKESSSWYEKDPHRHVHTPTHKTTVKFQQDTPMPSLAQARSRRSTGWKEQVNPALTATNTVTPTAMSAPHPADGSMHPLPITEMRQRHLSLTDPTVIWLPPNERKLQPIYQQQRDGRRHTMPASMPVAEAEKNVPKKRVQGAKRHTIAEGEASGQKPMRGYKLQHVNAPTPYQRPQVRAQSHGSVPAPSTGVEKITTTKNEHKGKQTIGLELPAVSGQKLRMGPAQPEGTRYQMSNERASKYIAVENRKPRMSFEKKFQEVTRRQTLTFGLSEDEVYDGKCAPLTDKLGSTSSKKTAVPRNYERELAEEQVISVLRSKKSSSQSLPNRRLSNKKIPSVVDGNATQKMPPPTLPTNISKPLSKISISSAKNAGTKQSDLANQCEQPTMAEPLVEASMAKAIKLANSNIQSSIDPTQCEEPASTNAKSKFSAVSSDIQPSSSIKQCEKQQPAQSNMQPEAAAVSKSNVTHCETEIQPPTTGAQCEEPVQLSTQLSELMEAQSDVSKCDNDVEPLPAEISCEEQETGKPLVVAETKSNAPECEHEKQSSAIESQCDQPESVQSFIQTSAIMDTKSDAFNCDSDNEPSMQKILCEEEESALRSIPTSMVMVAPSSVTNYDTDIEPSVTEMQCDEQPSGIVASQSNASKCESETQQSIREMLCDGQESNQPMAAISAQSNTSNCVTAVQPSMAPAQCESQNSVQSAITCQCSAIVVNTSIASEINKCPSITVTPCSQKSSAKGTTDAGTQPSDLIMMCEKKPTTEASVQLSGATLSPSCASRSRLVKKAKVRSQKSCSELSPSRQSSSKVLSDDARTGATYIVGKNRNGSANTCLSQMSHTAGDSVSNSYQRPTGGQSSCNSMHTKPETAPSPTTGHQQPRDSCPEVQISKADFQPPITGSNHLEAMAVQPQATCSPARYPSKLNPFREPHVYCIDGIVGKSECLIDVEEACSCACEEYPKVAMSSPALERNLHPYERASVCIHKSRLGLNAECILPKEEFQPPAKEPVNKRHSAVCYNSAGKCVKCTSQTSADNMTPIDVSKEASGDITSLAGGTASYLCPGCSYKPSAVDQCSQPTRNQSNAMAADRVIPLQYGQRVQSIVVVSPARGRSMSTTGTMTPVVSQQPRGTMTSEISQKPACTMTPQPAASRASFTQTVGSQRRTVVNNPSFSQGIQQEDCIPQKPIDEINSGSNQCIDSDEEGTLYTGVNPFIEAQVMREARNSIPAHLKDLPDNCYHQAVPKKALCSFGSKRDVGIHTYFEAPLKDTCSGEILNIGKDSVLPNRQSVKKTPSVTASTAISGTAFSLAAEMIDNSNKVGAQSLLRRDPDPGISKESKGVMIEDSCWSDKAKMASSTPLTSVKTPLGKLPPISTSDSQICQSPVKPDCSQKSMSGKPSIISKKSSAEWNLPYNAKGSTAMCSNESSSGGIPNQAAKSSGMIPKDCSSAELHQASSRRYGAQQQNDATEIRQQYSASKSPSKTHANGFGCQSNSSVYEKDKIFTNNMSERCAQAHSPLDIKELAPSNCLEETVFQNAIEKPERLNNLIENHCAQINSSLEVKEISSSDCPDLLSSRANVEPPNKTVNDQCAQLHSPLEVREIVPSDCQVEDAVEQPKQPTNPPDDHCKQLHSPLEVKEIFHSGCPDPDTSVNGINQTYSSSETKKIVSSNCVDQVGSENAIGPSQRQIYSPLEIKEMALSDCADEFNSQNANLIDESCAQIQSPLEVKETPSSRFPDQTDLDINMERAESSSIECEHINSPLEIQEMAPTDCLDEPGLQGLIETPERFAASSSNQYAQIHSPLEVKEMMSSSCSDHMGYSNTTVQPEKLSEPPSDSCKQIHSPLDIKELNPSECPDEARFLSAKQSSKSSIGKCEQTNSLLEVTKITSSNCSDLIGMQNIAESAEHCPEPSKEARKQIHSPLEIKQMIPTNCPDETSFQTNDGQVTSLPKPSSDPCDQFHSPLNIKDLNSSNCPDEIGLKNIVEQPVQYFEPRSNLCKQINSPLEVKEMVPADCSDEPSFQVADKQSKQLSTSSSDFCKQICSPLENKENVSSDCPVEGTFQTTNKQSEQSLMAANDLCEQIYAPLNVSDKVSSDCAEETGKQNIADPPKQYAQSSNYLSKRMHSPLEVKEMVTAGCLDEPSPHNIAEQPMQHSDSSADPCDQIQSPLEVKEMLSTGCPDEIGFQTINQQYEQLSKSRSKPMYSPLPVNEPTPPDCSNEVNSVNVVKRLKHINESADDHYAKLHSLLGIKETTSICPEPPAFNGMPGVPDLPFEAPTAEPQQSVNELKHAASRCSSTSQMKGQATTEDVSQLPTDFQTPLDMKLCENVQKTKMLHNPLPVQEMVPSCSDMNSSKQVLQKSSSLTNKERRVKKKLHSPLPVKGAISQCVNEAFAGDAGDIPYSEAQ